MNLNSKVREQIYHAVARNVSKGVHEYAKKELGLDSVPLELTTISAEYLQVEMTDAKILQEVMAIYPNSPADAWAMAVADRLVERSKNVYLGTKD